MRKRYVVFGLAAVLAIALTVPALGGPSNPIATTAASVKSTAKKALKKAKKANTAAQNAQATADGAASAAAKAQQDANSAQTSADTAQTTAEGAQTTADGAAAAAAAAQTSADAAQASADAAQATADTKYGDMTRFEGTASATNSDSPKLVSANCGSGEEATGGGWATNGAGNNDVTPTISSTFYLDQWIVQMTEIGGGTASTWSVGANVMCINQT